MICPKCAARMERVRVDEVEVDRCTHCHGLWLDLGEREALAAAAAAKVDTGAPRPVIAGRRDIECPRCRAPLVRLHDPATGIAYEKCSPCSGAFLDAGELKGLAATTLGQRLRRLIGL